MVCQPISPLTQIEKSAAMVKNEKIAITDQLKIALKDAEEYAVILTAKKDVTYQRYLAMMSFLKSNNIVNISIGIRDIETNN